MDRLFFLWNLSKRSKGIEEEGKEAQPTRHHRLHRAKMKTNKEQKKERDFQNLKDRSSQFARTLEQCAQQQQHKTSWRLAQVEKLRITPPPWLAQLWRQKGQAFKAAFFQTHNCERTVPSPLSQREREGRYLPIPSAQFTISQLQVGAVRDDRSL